MKSISKTLAVLVILLVGNVAFAQYGTWAAQSVNGTQFWTPPGVIYNGVPQQVVNPYYNGMPMQYGAPQYYGSGMPQVFNQGNYRCSTVTNVIGGLVGAYAGYEIGRRIRVGNTHLNVPGALLGAGAGQQIACELVGPPVRQVIAQPMVQTVAPMQYGVSQPMYTSAVPAEQQVGGVTTVSRRIVRTESNCSVDGHPELQNMKGLSEEQCAAITKMATVHGTVSANDPPVPQTASAPADTSRIPACVVNTPTKSYRFNAVDGKKFGPDQCKRYLAKLDPLPDEKSMSVLP